MTTTTGHVATAGHTVRRIPPREPLAATSISGRRTQQATSGERHGGWKDVLRRSWLIDGQTATDALLDADGPALHVADFPSGHQIFTEGEPADRIYVIISGIVKITSTVAHGRQVVRALLGPSECARRADNLRPRTAQRNRYLPEPGAHRLVDHVLGASSD